MNNWSSTESWHSSNWFVAFKTDLLLVPRLSTDTRGRVCIKIWGEVYWSTCNCHSGRNLQSVRWHHLHYTRSLPCHFRWKAHLRFSLFTKDIAAFDNSAATCLRPLYCLLTLRLPAFFAITFFALCRFCEVKMRNIFKKKT